MFSRLISLSSILVTVGFMPSSYAGGSAGSPVGAKLLVPSLPDRPKAFLVESSSVNFIIHHGEGEPLDEGSLVIGAYKDDKTSPVPVDLWLSGLVTPRDGELFDSTVIRSASNVEELILIVFIKDKGMINAKVLHYAPESHALTPLKELDDLRGRNSVEIIRYRCSRFPDLVRFFEVEKVEKK
jgi:hypothetical protein